MKINYLGLTDLRRLRFITENYLTIGIKPKEVRKAFWYLI